MSKKQKMDLTEKLENIHGGQFDCSRWDDKAAFNF